MIMTPIGHELIAITEIQFSKHRPRNFFDNDRLEELARSMQSKGVLQSLIVKPAPVPDDNNKYILIAGERRLQAAKIAGLTNVPAYIISASDRECFEISLMENIQREDLTPMEEAESFGEWIKDANAHLQLPAEFKSYEEWLAHKIGVSISFIRSRLALLKLPQKVKDMVDGGTILVSKVPLINTFDKAEDKITAAKIIAAFPGINDSELKKRVITHEGMFFATTRRGTSFYESHEREEARLFWKSVIALHKKVSSLHGGIAWEKIKQYIPRSEQTKYLHIILDVVTDLGYVLIDASADADMNSNPAIKQDMESFLEFILSATKKFPDEFQKAQRQEAQRKEKSGTGNLTVIKA
jgi:ParB family chromosome partitioning protein